MSKFNPIKSLLIAVVFSFFIGGCAEVSSSSKSHTASFSLHFLVQGSVKSGHSESRLLLPNAATLKVTLQSLAVESTNPIIQTAEITAGATTLDVPFEKVPYGDYALTAAAHDAAGNIILQASSTFTLSGLSLNVHLALLPVKTATNLLDPLNSTPVSTTVDPQSFKTWIVSPVSVIPFCLNLTAASQIQLFVQDQNGALIASVESGTAPRVFDIIPASTGPFYVTLFNSGGLSAADLSLQIGRYHLAVQASTGGTATPADTKAPIGSPIAINAIADAGYKFAGWSTVSGTGVTFTDAAMSSTAVILTSGDAVIIANFIPNTYVLTVVAGAGGSITLPAGGTATLNSGTPAPLTASPNAGYVFANWTINSGVGVNIADINSASTTVALSSGPATIQSNFVSTASNLIVTATPGGSIATPLGGALTAPYGTPISIAVNTLPGYTFSSWSVISGTGAVIANPSLVTTTVTLSTGTVQLQANFTPVTYPLTFSITPPLSGTVQTVPAGGIASYGQPINLVATAAPGYTFNYWQETPALGLSFSPPFSSSTAITVTSSPGTIEAVFSPNSYAVSYLAAPLGAGTITGPSALINGQTDAISATAMSGYTFLHWQVVSGSAAIADINSQVSTITMGADPAQIQAVFTPNSYPLILLAAPALGGSVTAPLGTITTGAPATISAVPYPGYTFVRWQETPPSTAVFASDITPTTTVTVSGAPGTFEAVFAATGYNLSFVTSVQGTESITLGSSPAASGINLEVTATPSPGYAFSSWTVFSGSVSIQSPSAQTTTITMGSVDTVLQANYTPISYAISTQAVPPGSGNIVAPSFLFANANTSISATSNTGWIFNNWSPPTAGTITNPTLNATNFTLTPANNAVLQANFLPLATLNTSAFGTTTPTGAVPSPFLSATNISATPSLNYVFNRWVVDSGTGVTFANITAPNTTLQLSIEPATIHAHFSQYEPQWASTHTAVSTTDGYYYAVATAPTSGNTYAAGIIIDSGGLGTTFNFGLDAGSNPVQLTIPTSYTGYSAVLVKYDNLGRPVWAKKATGTANSQYLAIALDSAENVYVAGLFTSPTDLDLGNSVTATHTATGNNILLVKYDSSGQTIWGRSQASGGFDNGLTSIAVDSTNSALYVGGFIQGTAINTLDPGVTVTGLVSGQSLLVAKYSTTTGVASWAKTVTAAPSQSRVDAIAIDGNHDLLVAGFITGATQYNLSATVNTTGFSSTGTNALIAKYDSAGTALWAKSTVAAPGSSSFTGIACNSSNEIYAVGSVSGIGPTTFDASTVTTGLDGDNALIVKFNSLGTAQFISSTDVAAVAPSIYRGVAVDALGNVFAAGYYTGGATGGLGFAFLNTPASYVGQKSLLVKYTSVLASLWAQAPTSTSADSSLLGVSLDSADNPIVAGYIHGSGLHYFDGLTSVAGSTANNSAFLLRY